MIGVRRDPKPAPPAGAEPLRTHQAGDPLAAHPVPALPELGVHPRTAIALAALSVDRLNLDAEPLIDRSRYMSIDAESCFGVSDESDGKSDGKKW
jgi:hypothetical protein